MVSYCKDERESQVVDLEGILVREKPQTTERKRCCCPPPIFIPVISAVQIAIFLYDYATSGNENDIWEVCGGCEPFGFEPEKKWQPWRLLTPALAHFGLGHLVSNMVDQLPVGCALELEIGTSRLALLYTIAVILGSMFSFVMEPDIGGVGCSDGVYAIYGATLVVFALSKNLKWRWLRFGGLLAYVAFEIFVIMFLNWFRRTCYLISWKSHIAGALTGFLVSPALFRNCLPRRVIGILLFIYSLIFTIAIVLFIVTPPGDPDTDWDRFAINGTLTCDPSMGTQTPIMIILEVLGIHK